MEEVKAVTDILEDALTKIKNVTSTSNSPNVNVQSQQSQRTPINTGQQQQGRRQNQTDSTFSPTVSTNRQNILPSESCTPSSSTGQNLLGRAQSNLRQVAVAAEQGGLGGL